MPKRTAQQKRTIIRAVNAPLLGPTIMRQITARGVTAVALPHVPTATHLRTLQSKVAQSHSSGKHSGGQGMTAAEVVQVVLVALQSGPVRQAVEAIAEQMVEQTQTRAASIMNQGGAYQRQGGF